MKIVIPSVTQLLISLNCLFFTLPNLRADTNELFGRVGEDTALVVRVNRPKELFKSLKLNLKCVKEDQLVTKISEKISDSILADVVDSTVIEKHFCNSFFEHAAEMFDVMSLSQEMILVLNNQSKVDSFILLLKLDPEHSEDMQRLIVQLNSAWSAFFANEGLAESDEDIYASTLQIFHRKIGQYDVLGIGNRTDFDAWSFPDTDKKLVDIRRFKTAESILHARAGDGDVEIFATPKYLRAFFPDSDEVWKGSKLDDMPMIAASASFKTTEGDEPIILLRGIATFTLPRVGIGKLLEASEPIGTFEVLDAPFFQLVAVNRNNEKYFESKAQIYAESTGDPDYMEKQLEKIYSQRSMEYKTDVLNKCKDRFNFRTRETCKDGIEQNSGILVEKIKEFDVAKRFVEKTVLIVNSRREPSRCLIKQACDHGDLYHEDNDNLNSDCYFLNDDWMLSGSRSDVVRFLDEVLIQPGNPNPNCLINDRVASVAKNVAAEKPFQLELYSPTSWDHRTYSAISDRMRKKGALRVEDVDSIKFKIEGEQDLRAFVLSNFLASMANRFGTQIHLYSQNDSTVFLDIAVFGAPAHIFGEGSDWRLGDRVESLKQKWAEAAHDSRRDE
jgi:hypothetical protein